MYVNYYSHDNTQNLSILMSWDPSKNFPVVRPESQDELILQTLPVQGQLSDDTIQKTTIFITTLLEKLFEVTGNAKSLISNTNWYALIHYGNTMIQVDGSAIDLYKCSQTIRIFQKFWSNDTLAKLNMLQSITEKKEQERNILSKFFNTRVEAGNLKATIQKIEARKDIAAFISYKPHVGNNSSGLFISEVILKENSPSLSERRIYRIKGDPKQTDDSAILDATLYKGQFQKKNNQEEFPLPSGNEETTLILERHLTKCSRIWESHHCAYKKAEEVLHDVIQEVKPGRIVMLRDDANGKEFIKGLSQNNTRPSVLLREHPFLTEAKP